MKCSRRICLKVVFVLLFFCNMLFQAGCKKETEEDEKYQNTDDSAEKTSDGYISTPEYEFSAGDITILEDACTTWLTPYSVKVDLTKVNLSKGITWAYLLKPNGILRKNLRITITRQKTGEIIVDEYMSEQNRYVFFAKRYTTDKYLVKVSGIYEAIEYSYSIAMELYESK